MSAIASLVVKEIIKQNLKKQVLRAVQRKVGVNKFASLIRRFDKKKTFVKNLHKDPKKMVGKMFKQYAKRKVLGSLPPVRYIMNWRKYGLKESMKRLLFKVSPTELKKPIYFFKGIKNRYEKLELMTYGKKVFWEELDKYNSKRQARILDTIVKFDPDNEELREYWKDILDKDVIFKANSPMTQNFSQMLIYYNISKEKLNLPIRGFAGTQIKFYEFKQVPWEFIKKAMSGADFGIEVYSKIRTANADMWAKYWAPRDPHYNK